MKTTIYVVRHGESEHNRDNLVSGHSNPALTKQGIAQAEAARDKLSHITFDEAYSSDLERAVDTGSIIYGASIPEPHRLFELRERSYGSYEGVESQIYINMRAGNEPHLLNLDNDSRWKFKQAPDIESDHELASRFIAALQAIGHAHPGKTMLVAAHGGSIRTMLIQIGFASDDQLPSRAISNAAYVELVFDGNGFEVKQTSGINKVS